MVFTELRPQIDQLPHDERVKAMAYLKHLLRRETPEHKHELAEGHVGIEAGKGVQWENLKKELGL